MESVKSNNPFLVKTPKKKVTSLFPPPSPSKSSAIDPPPSSSVFTPEKRNPLLPRIRNHNVALSIKDVRRTAAQLTRKSNLDRLEDNNKLGLETELGFPRDRLPDNLCKVNGGGSKAVNVGGKSIGLAERFEMLCKFFNAMDSSIRLLKCRRLSSTFTNICPQVESLTDRRFTVGHLAQLKYLLPESILLKRILVQDEAMGCMKDDLLIMLDGKAIKNDENAKDVSRCRNLREAFRVRLTNYCKSHSEDVDVPEGDIPEVKSLKRNEFNDCNDKKFSVVAASHVSPSFKRKFSQKSSIRKVEETAADIIDSPAVAECPNEDSVFDEVPESSQSLRIPVTPKKMVTDSMESKDLSSKGNVSIVGTPSKVVQTPRKSISCVQVLETPSKMDMDTLESKDLSLEGGVSIKGTPAKVALTPAKLMSATPALKSEKRPCMSPIDETPRKLVRRSNRPRSLKFDPPEETDSGEDQVNADEGSSLDKDVLDILPESLLQSVREKERRILEEQDPAISQAKRRQQLIAGLPKLFDIVRLLFQSIKRSVITKEEFIYKVIAGHSDIVDRGQIEEQLKLLLELAPEYLTEKSCLSGSTLLHLNKSSSADSIRSKLLEAKCDRRLVQDHKKSVLVDQGHEKSILAQDHEESILVQDHEKNILVDQGYWLRLLVDRGPYIFLVICTAAIIGLLFVYLTEY